MSGADDDLTVPAWLDADDPDLQALGGDPVGPGPADAGEEPADVRHGDEVRLPPEVSEYDAVEQARAVALGEEYR